MKKAILTCFALLLAATNAHAIQETFTTAGTLDCTAVLYCVQNTSDNLFKLQFVPTYPTSAPSPTGFNVNEKSIEVYNANGGLLDLNGLQIALIGSDWYNGATFIGAIQLEVQDAAGTWSYVTQWSTSISRGIYVLFNGKTPSGPLVRSVRGIRLTGVNGATAFRIGMLNLTAR